MQVWITRAATGDVVSVWRGVRPVRDGDGDWFQDVPDDDKRSEHIGYVPRNVDEMWQLPRDSLREAELRLVVTGPRRTATNR